MYTKCPECNAVFSITDDQLEIAEGLVRCGLCDAVFNGKDHLHVGQEALLSADDGLDKREIGLADEYPELEDSLIDIEAEHEEDDETLIAADKIPTALREDFGGSLLSKPSTPLQMAMWTTGAIALAIFFLGQITYWQNVDVLPQAWVDKFCTMIGCQSDIERDLSAIKILNRNIYTHPNVENALMITASIVNQSQMAQPFPLFQITLLDTQGDIVAIRRFLPEDYLVNKDHIDILMQPNAPAGARLEVVDPGSTVIAYEIEFY